MFLKINFIYLFLAVVGLRCCAGFSLVVAGGYCCSSAGFNSCGSWALGHTLNSCGTLAQLLCGTWDLPGLGIEPMSPALAGRFFTTEPPGKPPKHLVSLSFSGVWEWLSWTIVSGGCPGAVRRGCGHLGLEDPLAGSLLQLSFPLFTGCWPETPVLCHVGLSRGSLSVPMTWQ